MWRWGWTLNTDALWFSVPLALAETYGLLTAFFLAHPEAYLFVRQEYELFVAQMGAQLQGS